MKQTSIANRLSMLSYFRNQEVLVYILGYDYEYIRARVVNYNKGINGKWYCKFVSSSGDFYTYRVDNIVIIRSSKKDVRVLDFIKLGRSKVREILSHA